MKVDQMTKPIPTDDDVWILRNPSYHQRMKPGKEKTLTLFFLFSSSEKILEDLLPDINYSKLTFTKTAML
jgi:hypothetical protein